MPRVINVEIAIEIEKSARQRIARADSGVGLAVVAEAIPDLGEQALRVDGE